MNSNMFELTKTIKAAVSGGSSGITDAIFAAGYRKPDRSVEDAVMLTIETLAGFEGADIPWEQWPKNFDGVLVNELNELIEVECHNADGSAAHIAKAVLSAGYRKVGE
ncbi:hypothetical protein [Hafnia paralvei]|jgi:hypothetical protein|uniref:hypothetical protein n=1 Tax=Hafnia paralvei TaxID=546367 RepID=UPI003A0FDF52